MIWVKPYKNFTQSNWIMSIFNGKKLSSLILCIFYIYWCFREYCNNSNLKLICFCILKVLLKKFKFLFMFFYFKLIFLVFLDHFDTLMSKIISKKYKKFILIHFQIKNTLKNNHNLTLKSTHSSYNMRERGKDFKVNIHLTFVNEWWCFDYRWKMRRKWVMKKLNYYKK